MAHGFLLASRAVATIPTSVRATSTQDVPNPVATPRADTRADQWPLP